MFSDQTWWQMAFCFVQDVAVYRHPGYNVGYWNAPFLGVFKDLTWGVVDPDGGIEPLCIFQFSGMDFENPAQMSKHQNRTVATGDLLELFEDYAKRGAFYA